MIVIAWIVEGTWPPAWTPPALTRPRAPASRCSTSPHPRFPAPPAAPTPACSAAHVPDLDPGTRLEHLAAASAGQLLAAAAARLGRPCTRVERSGRAEREVVAAAEGAGLLVLARDGDRARLGPRSLGPASRFIVDHAPCPVLLVWPGSAPGVATMPPAPPPPAAPPVAPGSL